MQKATEINIQPSGNVLIKRTDKSYRTYHATYSSYKRLANVLENSSNAGQTVNGLYFYRHQGIK